jgi:DNA-binding PadR family transcriptional regulator
VAERISTLGYALLGLLGLEPLSGYDLSRQLQRPISYFWTAQRSHIYPELGRLEERGLVTHERVEQLDRPDKKVYSSTRAGREEVRRWVCQAPEEYPSRDALVLRAYFLSLADPHEAIRLFREEERRHSDQLALYQARLDYAIAEGDNRSLEGRWFGNFLALKRGVGYEREYAEWCGFVADEIERHATSAGLDLPADHTQLEQGAQGG